VTDNPAKRGRPDRSRVNISQLHEIRFWSRKFKCTQRELVLAHGFALSCFHACNPGDVLGCLKAANEKLAAVRKSARKKASGK
jgi:hypothetical protein